MSKKLRIDVAPWAEPLLVPYARYRGAFGGRASGKSWFFAMLMIARHYQRQPTFSVCIREIQKDLKHSAKRLLEIQIEKFKLGPWFQVQESQIKTPGGGLIIFQGMQSHNAESVKSLESYDIAWIEEAQTISQRSLDLLRPTLRKDGSEIWASWNPRFEDDPIDVFLRQGDPPESSVIVKVNFEDNIWLPAESKKEIEYDKKRDPDKYAHIWLGDYQRHTEARVFKNWTIEEFETDPNAMFRFGADWGFANDPTALVRCYVMGRKIFVDYEAYEVGCEIIDTPDLFHTVPESDRWPIVADSARPETISHLRKNGFPKIYAAKKGKDSINDGIEFLKSYDIVVHPRCKHTIDELSLYSYKIDKKTEKVLPVLEDSSNHCIAKGQLVTCLRGNIPIEKVTIKDHVLTREGFKPVLFSGLTGINRKIVEIKTKNGNRLLCTADHKIWTSKGFVKADSLRYGDEVLSLKKESSWQQSGLNSMDIFTDVIQTLKEKVTEDISDRLLKGNHAICIDQYGNITKDRYRMDIISIILMVIHQTMIFQILNVLMLKNIEKGISGLKKNLKNKESILKILGHLQKHGIDQRKDIKNIKKLAQWLINISSLKKRNVNFVKNIFIQKQLETEINFVQINANQHGAENLALMMKKGSAHNAKVNLYVTNTVKKNVVADHVRIVKEIPLELCVYDLTVKDCHEFFANGILVSNCIDSIRYALESQRRTEKSKRITTITPIETKSYF